VVRSNPCTEVSQTTKAGRLAAKPPATLNLIPQWREKKPERKRKNLIRLGVPQGKAYAWSRTRMGGWAVALSPILRTTITVKRLWKRGYQSLTDYYGKIAPQLNEPSRYGVMV